MIYAGDTATYTCTTSDSPPAYWHFYSLALKATPCGFDSSRLHPGISLCPSVPRISVVYSATQQNLTTLTISRAMLSDAGTYTCGSNNPNYLSTAHSVIVGVIGKHRPWLINGLSFCIVSAKYDTKSNRILSCSTCFKYFRLILCTHNKTPV